MSHKGNDMYYEQQKENADEMLYEKRHAYNHACKTMSLCIDRYALLKELKADIKRIKTMYKEVLK
jgi:hypothetical protein